MTVVIKIYVHVGSPYVSEFGNRFSGCMTLIPRTLLHFADTNVVHRVVCTQGHCYTLLIPMLYIVLSVLKDTATLC